MISFLPNSKFASLDDLQSVVDFERLGGHAAQRHVGVGCPTASTDDRRRRTTQARRAAPDCVAGDARRILDDCGRRRRPRPLVISVSLPARRIDHASADRRTPSSSRSKPSAIDSTATNTSTTPAMPTTATVEEPSRCADRSEVDAGDRDDLGQHSVSPQRVDDAQPAGLQGGQEAGHEPERRRRARCRAITSRVGK